MEQIDELVASDDAAAASPSGPGSVPVAQPSNGTADGGDVDMSKGETADFMSWYGSQFQEEEGDTASPLKLAVVQDEEEAPGGPAGRGGKKRGSVFSFAPNPVSPRDEEDGSEFELGSDSGALPTDEVGLQAMVFKQAQELDEALERIRQLEGDVSEKEENLRLTAEIGQTLLGQKTELEHDNADLHEELDHLRAELETTEKEGDKALQTTHELNAELKQLKPKLDGSREQLAELQKANFSVTQKLQNAESQIQVGGGYAGQNG
jgi:hypothetical protein